MKFVETERIRALPPYLFLDIDRKKRAALEAGRDVIDFGMGDPDQPTHAFIIDAMNAALRKPANHRYPIGGGLAPFRRAIAEFVQRRYGVTVDPTREVLALIGSKEGIGHLPLAVVNPGQTVLIPSPGYPVYRAGTIFAGGVPHVFELAPERDWRPDFSTIPSEVAKQAVLIFLNYPNNPTGATADLKFLAEAVAFARAYDLLLAYDAAYNDLYLTDERPPSVLQVPGARDVAIEFHSASKTFNMTGWRIGFALGNAEVLSALLKIKSNLDTGVFGAIQEATAAAYAGIDRPELHASRELYRARATRMVAGLRACGFEVAPPKATFYVWPRVPRGYDSLRLCTKLLDEADVVCVPGIGFGPNCDEYVRFSLSVPDERIDEALTRMRRLKW